MQAIGWRKLSAWLLVFILVAFATAQQLEITDNGVEILKWVTGFFFGANALEHSGKVISVKKQEDTK